jgi:hypothetical protein
MKMTLPLTLALALAAAACSDSPSTREAPSGSSYAGIDLAPPVLIEWMLPSTMQPDLAFDLTYRAVPVVNGSDLHVAFGTAAGLTVTGDSEKQQAGAVRAGSELAGKLTVRGPAGRHLLPVTGAISTPAGRQSFSSPVVLQIGTPSPLPTARPPRYTDQPAN